MAKEEGKDMMYEFDLSTGLRQGEILALSWSDIDFEKGTCTVSKNVSFDEKVIKNTKTSGFRRIRLSRSLLTKLQKYKEKQQLIKEQYGELYHHELDLVFPKSDGSIQTYYTVRREFYRLIEKANVRKITFHDLRKMHIFMLHSAGFPLEFLEYHTGIGTTNLIKYYFCREE